MKTKWIIAYLIQHLNYKGAVKEQRVDGSWCNENTLHLQVDGSWCNENTLHLRYTLKGFERNYQIRIPSNQINKIKLYSTASTLEAKSHMS